MPTPRTGETREQMNGRLKREGKTKRKPKGLRLADFRWNRARWAPKTSAVYGVCWRAFVEHYGQDETFPAPARNVADFLTTYSKTHSTSAVSVALAAIRAAHKDVKGTLPKMDARRELYVLDDPVIVDAWKDIARTKGTAKQPKAAIVTADLKRIIRSVPVTNYLHRAILLLGFASAMRRSEIVALNREDLEFSDDGVTITIRRSKTDKLGKGEAVAIVRSVTEFCAVRAIEQWLEHSGIIEGAIFRNRFGKRLFPATVAQIVKRWAREAGFDPKTVAAHSLRRGCITSMFKNGTDIKNVMTHSRHATISIAMGYVEADRAMKNPGLKNLGL